MGGGCPETTELIVFRSVYSIAKYPVKEKIYMGGGCPETTELPIVFRFVGRNNDKNDPCQCCKFPHFYNLTKC